jgi:hypothetical protein
MESISIETPTILGDAESMDAVISEVRKRLMSKGKSLAPWLFYDDAGSALCEDITACQGLFEHGRLQAGQSVLVHGAAGAVGSMVTQRAREAGAYVIGTGRAADRQTVFDFGAQEFVDLDNDALEDVGEVDLVFDVIGGDIGKRSAGVSRAGGTLVSIVGPPEAGPADGLAVDFVVEPDRAQLSEIVQRVRDRRLRTNIGNVSTLDDASPPSTRPSDARGRRSSAFVREDSRIAQTSTPYTFHSFANGELTATRSARKQSIGGSLCSIENRKRRSID